MSIKSSNRTYYVDLDYGILTEPKRASYAHVDVEQWQSDPLTQDEATALNALVRRRMVVQGFRDNQDGLAELGALVRGYLKEIGKLNESW
jgi:glycine/D-amino acid oxidase-like deaminating enzyme